MALLIVTPGVALFLGLHLIAMAPVWRAALVDRIGERPYKTGFSLVAFSG
jgi:uncharacterized membrane protein